MHPYANSNLSKIRFETDPKSLSLSLEINTYSFITNIPQRSKMLEALDFRWLGFEEQLFTCTRSMAIMGPTHCIHLGVAMLLCFGTCKDSHSPPKGALILPEWQNS